MPKNSNKRISFPDGFLWGTATSSHQIEGDNNNDWTLFERETGRIYQGQVSGKACDSWNRFNDDIAIMKELNQNAYRFSVEWSRIIPSEGEINHSAIDRYGEMIKNLRENNIEPFVTLHHFTLPTWIAEKGSLTYPQVTNYFAEYVKVIAKAFSDKVTFWNTINEPNVLAVAGYFLGEFPPAEKSIRKYLSAIKNLLRMHAISYKILKQADSTNKVGLVKNIIWFYPLREKSFMDRRIAGFCDYFFNSITLRALKTGKLPLAYLRKYDSLRRSFDFMGLNFYNLMYCSRTLDGGLIPHHPDNVNSPELCEGLNWEPYPEGLYLSLKLIKRKFGNIPIYITENGIGTSDEQIRIKYIRDHLLMVYKAIKEGIDVKGYFHWTLIDNFEWAQGYSSHFGLAFVDPKTFQRTIKEGGYYYGEIAKNNALVIH